MGDLVPVLQVGAAVMNVTSIRRADRRLKKACDQDSGSGEQDLRTQGISYQKPSSGKQEGAGRRTGRSWQRRAQAADEANRIEKSGPVGSARTAIVTVKGLFLG